MRWPWKRGATQPEAELQDGSRPTDAGAPLVTPHADHSEAPPAKRASDHAPASTSAEPDVAAFVAQMKALGPRLGAGRGRLMFAMDATMSRQPTWDMALALQAEMFRAVKDVGGLDVQLVYFRGSGECRASKWVSDPEALGRLMTTVTVAGGYTQIRKVLDQARRETEKARVHALVYVGDAMEEDVDDLCGRAGELAVLGVPVFLFQEGNDQRASRAFAEIARLTRGAHCKFDAGSAQQLRELLRAVAVYAAGGRAALEDLGRSGGRGAQLLIGQMR
ncbi:MAG: VWA domain-containing protein [Hyphomicrobiaceae bacterium]